MAAHTGRAEHERGDLIRMCQCEVECNQATERDANNMRLLNTQVCKQRRDVFVIGKFARWDCGFAITSYIVTNNPVLLCEGLELVVPHTAICYACMDQEQGMASTSYFV